MVSRRCLTSVMACAFMAVLLAPTQSASAAAYMALRGDRATFRAYDPSASQPDRVFTYELSSGRLRAVTDAGDFDLSGGFAATARHAVFHTDSAHRGSVAVLDLATGGRSNASIDYPEAGSTDSFIDLSRSDENELALFAGRVSCFVDCSTFGSAYVFDPPSGSTERVGIPPGADYRHPRPGGGSDVRFNGECVEAVDVSSRWALWAENESGFGCSNYSPHALDAVFARDRTTGALVHVASSYDDVFPGERFTVQEAHLDGSRAVMVVVPRGESVRKLLVVDLATGQRRLSGPDPEPQTLLDVDGSKVLYYPKNVGGGEVWLYDVDTGANRRLLGPVAPPDQAFGNLDLSGDWLAYQQYRHDGEKYVQFTELLNVATGELRQVFPAPPASEPISRYVALGDSVAAGEGIGYGYEWREVPRFNGGTEFAWRDDNPSSENWETDQAQEYPTAKGFCHQSAQAYPRLVAQRLDVSVFKHLACTGSTAANGVLGGREENGDGKAPQQLRGEAGTPYGDADPDIVSLSLGANDIDFREEVVRCYDRRFVLGCDTNYARSELAIKLVNQQKGLEQVLEEVREIGRGDGKVPLVALSLYHNPLPADYPSDRCVDIDPPLLGGGLSVEELAYLRDGLKKLNDGIVDVARKFDEVVLVPPPREFALHPFCRVAAGDEGPWAFGPSITTQDGFPRTDIKAPFHPTAAGQAAIAGGVAKAVVGAQKVPNGREVNVAAQDGVRLRLSSVSRAGAATAMALAPSQSPPNTGFRLSGRVYEIATSAEWSGSATVSLPSSGPAELFHWTDGRWQQVPSSYSNGAVTATVNSLSPFALGTPVPVATASFASSGGGMAPTTVSFDGSGSRAETGSIASYEWDFGDGKTGTGPSPAHAYATSGTYEIKLRVTSDQGAVDELTKQVTLFNDPPVAALAAPTSADTNTPVSFSAAGSSDSNGTITERLWDFGDGSEPAGGDQVRHTYSKPGTYTVRLTVLDNEGASGTTTAPIRVAAPSPPNSGPGGGGSTPGGGDGGSSGGDRPGGGPSSGAPQPNIDPYAKCRKLKSQKKTRACIKQTKALARCGKLKGKRKKACIRRTKALARCDRLKGKKKDACKGKARRIR